jgi:hypothetical protein
VNTALEALVFQKKTRSSGAQDLSGLAALREPFAIDHRNEFFTPRREGAKKASESKSPVSFLDP